MCKDGGDGAGHGAPGEHPRREHRQNREPGENKYRHGMDVTLVMVIICYNNNNNNNNNKASVIIIIITVTLL